MTNRYSLADHQLVISFPEGSEEIIKRSGLADNKPIIIGGPGENGLDGSFVGSIKISRKNDGWDTEGDRTGSYVHNKNLDRTGSAKVDITQVSDQVITLSLIFSAYQDIQDAIGGLDIKVRNAYDPNMPLIASCHDCYIKNIPDQDFGEKASSQTWEFTCGRVMFYV